MVDVSLRFLGPLRLLVDGAHVHVERAQTRAFLALLARHPGTAIPSAALADMLWPDGLPNKPVEALRTLATRARKALGHDELLKTVGTNFVLDVSHSSIDLHQFRRAAERAQTVEELRHALGLWQGSPFADCGRVRRLLLEAEELVDRRWTLAERYLQALLRAGETDQALTFGLPLLDERPDDDRIGALLVIGLARAGREREARALVADMQALLLADDPTYDLTVLDQAEARIPTELPRAAPALAGAAPREERNPLASHVTTLFGRQPELAVLGEHAVEARDAGRMVVIVGEPGVGKTALAASFAARLGWQQRCVRCGSGSPDDPVDLAGRLGSATTGPATDVAATVVPLVSAEVRQWVEQSPGTVVLDDLQWATEVELLVVRGLVRNGIPPGALVIATVRPLDGLTSETARVVADILREPGVVTVDLGGLSPEAVRQLVRRHRPELGARECSRIHELTRGNAFAVRSLCELANFDVDQPITDLPAALLLLTGQRLAAVEAEPLALLELAALLDPPIDLGAVAALSGIDRVTLLTRIRPAFDLHLLVEDRPGEVRFDHELTRQAILQRTPPALRRAHHDRLAGYFIDRDLVVAGRHLCQALPDTDMAQPVPVLLNAAEAALGTGHYGVAIDCYTGAERLMGATTAEARRIALRRGLALEQAGRRHAATELYDRLSDDALAADDRDIVARAALAGLAQGVVGGDDRRRARLETAARYPTDDPRVELEVLVQLSTELGYAGEDLSEAHLLRAQMLADETPADQALLAFLGTQLLHATPTTDATFAQIERLGDLALAGGDLDVVVRALELRCSADLAVGDLVAARRSLARLDAQVRQHPAPRPRWSAALFRTILADLEHGLGAAAPLARAALDLGRNLELPDAENAFAIFKLAQAVRTGTLVRLEGLVRLAATGPKAVPAWHAVHAATLRASDRREEALAAIERFQVRYVRGRTFFPHLGLGLTIAATAGLEDTTAAAMRSWARAELEAWGGNLIVVGSGAGCFGPTDLYLALATAPLPQIPETWAAMWLDGAWQGLAEQLSGLASH